MEAQLQAFLESLRREHDYSHNTIAAYRNDLSQFLKFIGQAPHVTAWSGVDKNVVSAYVDAMSQRNYAPSSVARKVAALKSFFHYLFAHGEIAVDPTAEIESPKVEKRLPKTLSIEDIDRLLEAPTRKNTPKAMRDSALLALLYATGMRVTELVTLPVEDVKLEQGFLRCATRDGGEPRDLPFDLRTQEILTRYLESGRPSLLKDRDEEALFLNHRGQRLTRQGLWLIIKTYARQAKLGTKVTPHTLRHSFAAHKLKKGADLQEIQELLGHANISTTQIYTQLSTNNHGNDTLS
jgi:integrase/recombinase XerD